MLVRKLNFVHDNRRKKVKVGGHSDPVLRVVEDDKLRVAIVGRPNVGKSTLFNSIVGGYKAIADKTPGVTRDCQEGFGTLNMRFKGERMIKQFDIYSHELGKQIELTVVDTPGADNIDRMIVQTEDSLQSAHVAMLVTDYKDGPHNWDYKLAQYLRTRDMPVIHVLNKCDNLILHMNTDDIDTSNHHLDGLGKPIFISAEHKLGLSEIARALHPFYVALRLRKSISERLSFSTRSEKSIQQETEQDDTTMRLALVGRANVGKSTMLNKLIGKERVVVSSIPGTTRDTIELTTTYMHDDQQYRIILADTAGIRKIKHIADDRVQMLSHEDTMRTIRFANVVCLLVDGQEPLTAEDLDIARMIEQEGRGLIVVANKWDLVKDPYVIANRIEETVASSLSQVKGLSVVVCSALTGKNLPLVIRKCIECYKRWNARIPTSKLNAFLEKFLTTQSFPAYYPKIQYAAQVSIRPPRFAFFFKGRETELPQQFERQLLNAIRNEFNLDGVPLRSIQKSKTKLRIAERKKKEKAGKKSKSSYNHRS
jgi:GTP-binding protein